MKLLYPSGLLAVLIGLCVLAPYASGGALLAQASSPTIIVTVPESFPGIEARALLVREPGRVLVVLDKADSTVETLAAALGVLRNVQERRGEPTSGEIVPIVGYALKGELSRGVRGRLGSLLARLADRPLSPVGDLGPARWVEYHGL
jgi:hypothetical protein